MKVRIPGKGIIQFPDGTSEHEMNVVIGRTFPDIEGIARKAADYQDQLDAAKAEPTPSVVGTMASDLAGTVSEKLGRWNPGLPNVSDRPVTPPIQETVGEGDVPPPSQAESAAQYIGKRLEAGGVLIPTNAAGAPELIVPPDPPVPLPKGSPLGTVLQPDELRPQVPVIPEQIPGLPGPIQRAAEASVLNKAADVITNVIRSPEENQKAAILEASRLPGEQPEPGAVEKILTMAMDVPVMALGGVSMRGAGLGLEAAASFGAPEAVKALADIQAGKTTLEAGVARVATAMGSGLGGAAGKEFGGIVPEAVGMATPAAWAEGKPAPSAGDVAQMAIPVAGMRAAGVLTRAMVPQRPGLPVRPEAAPKPLTPEAAEGLGITITRRPQVAPETNPLAGVSDEQLQKMATQGSVTTTTRNGLFGKEETVTEVGSQTARAEIAKRAAERAKLEPIDTTFTPLAGGDSGRAQAPDGVSPVPAAPVPATPTNLAGEVAAGTASPAEAASTAPLPRSEPKPVAEMSHEELTAELKDVGYPVKGRHEAAELRNLVQGIRDALAKESAPPDIAPTTTTTEPPSAAPPSAAVPSPEPAPPQAPAPQETPAPVVSQKPAPSETQTDLSSTGETQTPAAAPGLPTTTTGATDAFTAAKAAAQAKRAQPDIADPEAGVVDLDTIGKLAVKAGKALFTADRGLPKEAGERVPYIQGQIGLLNRESRRVFEDYEKALKPFKKSGNLEDAKGFVNNVLTGQYAPNKATEPEIVAENLRRADALTAKRDSALKEIESLKNNPEKNADRIETLTKASDNMTESINRLSNSKAEFTPQTPEGKALAKAAMGLRARIDKLTDMAIEHGVNNGDVYGVWAGNVGIYVNRSYRAFQDRGWFDTVRKQQPELIENAVKLVQEKNPEWSREDAVKEVNEYMAEIESGQRRDFARSTMVGKKNTGILQHRLEISPQFRALLGENTDPGIRFATSVEKLADITANHKFLSDVAREGAGRIVPDGKGGQTTEGWLWDSDKLGHSSDPSGKATVQLSAAGNEALRPLDGKWVTPEIKEAFEKYYKPERGGALGRGYNQVNGWVKAMQTVGGQPRSLVSNLVGNPGLAIQAGWLNPVKYAKAVYGNAIHLRALGLEPSGKWGGMGDVVKEMTARGVLNQSEASLVAQMIKGDKIPIQKPGIVRRAADYYQSADNVFKIAGWLHELPRVEKMAKAEGWTGGREQILHETAMRVQNLTPSRERMWGITRMWQKNPFVGPFPMFHAEVVRNTGNAIMLGAKELRTPGMRKEGFERLVGILAAHGGMAAAGTYSAYKAGLSSKDVEEQRRTFAPWEKNTAHWWRTPDPKTGELRSWDLSRVNPFTALDSAVVAAMNEHTPLDRIQASVNELAKPYATQEILMGSLIQSIFTKKDDYGQALYDKSDNWKDRTAKGAWNIGKKLLPSIAVGQGKRLYWAYTGKKGKSTGRTYDLMEEVMATGGVPRATRVPVSDWIRRMGSAYKDAVGSFDSEERGPAAEINSALKSNPDMPLVDAQNLYLKVNIYRQEQFNEAKRNIEVARNQGKMSDTEIYNVLVDKAGMGQRDAKELIEGRFSLLVPDKKKFPEFYDKLGTWIPELAKSLDGEVRQPPPRRTPPRLAMKKPKPMPVFDKKEPVQ